jgi:hypothetical protein
MKLDKYQNKRKVPMYFSRENTKKTKKFKENLNDSHLILTQATKEARLIRMNETVPYKCALLNILVE